MLKTHVMIGINVKDNPTLDEMAQNLASTLGYKWCYNNKYKYEPRGDGNAGFPVLVFDTVDKFIYNEGEHQQKSYGNSSIDYTANTIEELYNYLKNPPATPVKKSENEKLPVVEFLYPHSVSGRNNLRKLKVTFMDNKYVEGYEISDNDNFKKFLISKIYDNVSLISF